MRVGRALLLAAGFSFLTGCTLGPDYRRPQVDVPVDWKLEGPWRVGTPQDGAPKGEWWRRFGDAQLDLLVDKALADSPTLFAANARLTQARATLAAAGALQYPQANLGLRGGNQRISANRPLTRYNSPNFQTIQDDFVVQLSVNYEVDLFGRVSRTIEGARASAEQSAVDFVNTRLLLTSDVASAYFNLRQVDTEIDVVSRSIALQQRALAFVTARHDEGAASGLDVAQQRVLIDNTLVQLDLLRRQRAQFENALATLTGTPAPSFALGTNLKRVAPPPIPIGMPSDLLERRPDVASAERAMAAANAQIGVAKAAFFPSIILGPSIGYESTSLSRLFDSASNIWSFGVSLLQPLFTAGRLNANIDFAAAGYDFAVANYRRVVLSAMQEVEDGITGTQTLNSAYAQAQVAIASATKLLDLATTRYEGGVATYLDVITAQQALLNAERQASQIEGQRLLVAVFLVKALGGDWLGPNSIARQDTAGQATKQ